MSLLEARPVTSTPARPDALPAAERELESLRPQLASQLRADLIETYIL